MSSAFPLPFKVDNQAILAKPNSEILHSLPLCGLYIPSFHLKQVYNYKQLFHQQNQNNYVVVHLFKLLHLHISVNMEVVRKIKSLNLVCDADLDKLSRAFHKISNEVQFRPNNGTTICTCMDKNFFQEYALSYNAIVSAILAVNSTL